MFFIAFELDLQTEISSYFLSAIIVFIAANLLQIAQYLLSVDHMAFPHFS
jgi:hypothetical protein